MSFDKTVVLPLKPEAVFALITEPERLRRWKTVAARIDLRVGGEYRWTITPGNSAMGTITEVDPGHRLVFTWGWDGQTDLPPGASTVSITLEEVPGGTSLRLVHEGLNEKQISGHAQGWNHYLDRLVEFSTYGKVAADPWSAAPQPIDELTSAEACLAIAQRVLLVVNSADLRKPTRCSEFNLGELIDHQYDSLVRISGALGIAVAKGSDSAPEIRVADLGQKIVEIFRHRGLQDFLTLGTDKMPANIVANILNIELLVHATDIAAAISYDLPISPVITDYVLQLAHNTITPALRESGLFSDEITNSGTEESTGRLLAYTGRQSI